MGLAALGVLAAASLLAAPAAEAGAPRKHEPIGFQLFESPQVDPLVLSADGATLYVAHTTANAVQVVSVGSGVAVQRIPVGMEPVSLALRPGGQELWVANHVSDTVSIIDIAPASPTRWKVIDTIQAIDGAGVSRFDEPAGIAFTGDGAKAYVALSSRDAIAVINADTRTVTGSIKVRAQDPRAIAVRNGRLYVAAFESGNRSELSACPTGSPPFLSGSPPQCTLGALDLVDFATNPNLPGLDKNIVADPQLPDRDLFVYDTTTDTEVSVASGIGTLLYGLTVSSAGRVFITQTDARNTLNGIEGENLIDLDNRMFSNEVAAVTCNPTCGAVTVRDLEPANPTHATAMATPYGVALSSDESTLVVTLAGSSRLAVLSAATLATLGVVDLGVGAGEFGQQIPKGVALRSGPGGVPETAYVLNSMENTISVVDLAEPASPVHTGKIPFLGDPVPDELTRGRVAFNNAFASSTGTFSCGSCHPDANVDQLLWRIGGACFFGACTGNDEPRTTMPIRGLKDTLPLHWDGTLGDPFGGPDGAVSNAGNVPPSCDLGGPDGDLDCFRHLVDGSLSGVMCEQSGGCASGPSGLPGLLDGGERDEMARFLASVAYPPARSRRIDDTISTAASPVPVPNGNGTPSGLNANALTGFQDFFTNQGGQANPNTCADSDAGCHTLPLGAATNSQTLQGFDVPTMRGMTDRFLQFSLGITATEETLVLANSGLGILGVSGLETPIRWNAADGLREITTFGVAFLVFQGVYNTRPLHTFQMFEEASTGFSGAQGRQVQLNQRTTGGGLLAETETHLAALELADGRGLVNLRGDGMRAGAPVTLSFRSDGLYKNGNDSVSLTRAQLISEAQTGTLVLALTAHLRSNWGAAHGAQPLLAPTGTGSNGVTGDPPLPVVASGSASNPPPITLVGTSVRPNAGVLVDGQPVTATISCSVDPGTGFCAPGNLSIDVNQAVALGLRLLQVQNPAGPLSNEMPVCVGNAGNCN